MKLAVTMCTGKCTRQNVQRSAETQIDIKTPNMYAAKAYQTLVNNQETIRLYQLLTDATFISLLFLSPLSMAA